MIKSKIPIFAMASVLLLSLITAIPVAMAAEVPLITKEELKARMEKGDVVVVDVRKGRDWDSSEFKIKGALRADPKNLAAWAGEQAKDKPTVLYCA